MRHEVMRMKVVKLNNEELNDAISRGPAYIEVGERKFMLFEVEQGGYYDVTDPEEVKLLLDALEGHHPSLTKQEVLKQLNERKRRM
ncbi:hypothetical protein D3C81_1888410 [compost metagenome]